MKPSTAASGAALAPGLLGALHHLARSILTLSANDSSEWNRRQPWLDSASW